ncbi:hypothetical protein CEXT_275781 [Caerostris extrusa]|uniref:Uncharacterized protein n=1 Tax=Caerostris extrusa TaxID=172846 RepID=A0AAV4S2A2_CAEEX|nr:hypothetical protein CEXT_275781 [Caerostris extrusa]
MRLPNAQGKSCPLNRHHKLKPHSPSLANLSSSNESLNVVAELRVPLAKLPITEEELQAACAKYRAQQNPTKSTTSQKRKKETDPEGFQKVPKHLTFKAPKGAASVNNPSISFPTNPQPTDLVDDPAPPCAIGT